MKFLYVNAHTRIPIDKISASDGVTILIGDGYLPPLSLDDELLGATNFIKSLCVLSKKKNNLILAGCKLFCGKKTFWGTLVIDCGKFVGISDMTHSVDSSYDESNVMRVFDTSIGRLGIVSGDDVHFFEVSRILRLWECDMLVYSLNSPLSRRHRILIEAQSMSNGVTAICISRDKTCAYGGKNMIPVKGGFHLTPTKSDILLNSRKPDTYSEIVKRPTL